MRQRRIVERPIWWRTYISSFLALTIGFQSVSVVMGNFSLAVFLGGTLGVSLGALISLALVSKRSIVITHTYVEGPSTLGRRVRIPLSDLNGRLTRKTRLGNLRLTSNRGGTITIDVGSFSKHQREEIIETLRLNVT